MSRAAAALADDGGMERRDGGRRGLLVDFGGVLTSDLFASLEAFCVRRGLRRTAVLDLMAGDPAGRALFHDVETGAIGQPAFDAGLAALLGLPTGAAGAGDVPGITADLLADLRLNRPLLDAVAAIRRAGVPVGVLSNSWGTRPYDPYAAADLPSLADVVVISHEVGLRKPDPAIYRLAAERLGLPPAACAFVDDVAANLAPAEALGMAAVRHVETGRTIAELRRLLVAPGTA